MRRKLDTRGRILREAYGEFQKRGYKRADINTIVRKAGVTKGALYYYFKSKEDLAANVIEGEITAKVEKKFLNYLDRDDSSLQQCLLDMTHDLSDNEVEKGSIFVKLANEISARQKESSAAIRAVFERMVGGIHDKLERDRQSGKLRAQIETERLAQAICALLIGSLTMSRTYQEREVFTRIIEQMNGLIDIVYAQ